MRGDFQVTWSKVDFKLVFEKMLSADCLLTPSLESCQTGYTEFYFQKVEIFRSCDQRSRSNCWSSSSELSTQYLIALWLMVTKLAILVVFREKIIHIAFWVKGHRQTTCLHFSIVRTSAKTLWIIWFLPVIAKFNIVFAREWIIHCRHSRYSTLLNFVPGGGGVYFSNISCSL